MKIFGFSPMGSSGDPKRSRGHPRRPSRDICTMSTKLTMLSTIVVFFRTVVSTYQHMYINLNMIDVVVLSHEYFNWHMFNY